MPATTTPVDLDRLESSLSNAREVVELRNHRPLEGDQYAQTQMVKDKMADFDVGKLTAEAVVKDYAATAERFAQASQELGKVAEQCEGLMHELSDARQALDEVANKYMERGRQIAEELAASADNTAKVRAQAMEWATKISETAPK